MKTIFTLLTSLFMSISVFAADAKPKSMLSVRSAGNEDIRVVLDGKRFEPNDNALIIQNLESGSHSIKVYRQRSTGYYTILGKRYELLYNTTINIRNKTHVLISIDRNGRTTMQESSLRNGRGNNDWYDGRDYNYDRDGQWGDYDTNNGYARAMDSREFSRVLQSMEREWRESNKIKSATQIAKANNLSTSQVVQLVQLFNMEEYKLELAKVAYANTIDKQNYSRVSDLLSFSSSKTELSRFIRNSR